MKSREIIFLIINISMILIFTGCFELAPGHSVDWDAREEVAEIMGVQENQLDSKVQSVDDNTSESHKMMAKMILKGEGLDDNFSKYERVYLIDIKVKETGETVKAVVVRTPYEDMTIIPKSVRERKK